MATPGIEDQVGVAAIGAAPADDAVREGVRHGGEPEHALAGWDADRVGHPQPIRGGGGEVPVDPVRRRRGRLILPGASCSPVLAQERALQTA
jgi:hypothetical protein